MSRQITTTLPSSSLFHGVWSPPAKTCTMTFSAASICRRLRLLNGRCSPLHCSLPCTCSRRWLGTCGNVDLISASSFSVPVSAMIPSAIMDLILAFRRPSLSISSRSCSPSSASTVGQPWIIWTGYDPCLMWLISHPCLPHFTVYPLSAILDRGMIVCTFSSDNKNPVSGSCRIPTVPDASCT